MVIEKRMNKSKVLGEVGVCAQGRVFVAFEKKFNPTVLKKMVSFFVQRYGK